MIVVERLVVLGADPAHDAAVARLREHGYAPEEHTFASYEESRAAYVTDPDGNRVGLVQLEILAGMGLELDKTDAALAELREKGLAA